MCVWGVERGDGRGAGKVKIWSNIFLKILSFGSFEIQTINHKLMSKYPIVQNIKKCKLNIRQEFL